MYLKEIETIFSNDFIFKQIFQYDMPVENTLTLWVGQTVPSRHHTYVCEYSLFCQSAACLELPSDNTFFIVNSEPDCSQLTFPLQSNCLFLNINMEDFCTRFAGLITEHKTQTAETNSLRMAAAWEQLMQGEQLDLSDHFFPFRKFVACIVIYSKKGLLSSGEAGCLLKIFRDFFEESNVFLYKNKIVILYSQHTRPESELNFCYSEWNSLLEKYNLYAAVSNACRHPDMFSTLYRTVSASPRLSQVLPAAGKYSRIISYNDFSMYYIIDLCVKEFIREHHHKDIIYLISPSIIELYRYDQKHNSDLHNTLFHYLLCGRNINDTAAVLYMHRNTVLNKLHKINSIIHLSLDDGVIQFTLLMSCFIVNYYENYIKKIR